MGLVDPGDTIELGRYPTRLDASAFGDWGDRGHVVSTVAIAISTGLWVKSTGDVLSFRWSKFSDGESYSEDVATKQASFWDYSGSSNDPIVVDTGSPSVPQTPVPLTEDTRTTDDAFVDVILNY